MNIIGAAFSGLPSSFLVKLYSSTLKMSVPYAVLCSLQIFPSNRRTDAFTCFLPILQFRTKTHVDSIHHVNVMCTFVGCWPQISQSECQKYKIIPVQVLRGTSYLVLAFPQIQLLFHNFIIITQFNTKKIIAMTTTQTAITTLLLLLSKISDVHHVHGFVTNPISIISRRYVRSYVCHYFVFYV